MKNIGGVLAAGAMTAGMLWADFNLDVPSPGWCWLITIGFAIVTVVISLVMVRDAATRIDACERGLVYLRGVTTQLLAYDRIRDLRVLMINGKRSALKIGLHDGGELTWIANVTNFDGLRAVVAVHVSRAELPRARVV